uniref:Uncharacterized protein n=1 Tax=Parascaris equorum TaxID=6256 RepID=A0A914S6B7_PAREQ
LTIHLFQWTLYAFYSSAVAYTCGVFRDTDLRGEPFSRAGLGVHWLDKPENNVSRRLSMFPVTLFRSQLQAIIAALEQVHSIGFSKYLIAVVCLFSTYPRVQCKNSFDISLTFFTGHRLRFMELLREHILLVMTSFSVSADRRLRFARNCSKFVAIFKRATVRIL